MATVRMDITDIPAPEMASKAQGLFEQLTRSAALFPAPVPAMAVFQAHINNLVDALAGVASNGGKREYQAKRMSLTQVRADIKCLAAYVQFMSNGDAELILASGFAVCCRGPRLGELARPRKLRSRPSIREGRAAFNGRAILERPYTLFSGAKAATPSNGSWSVAPRSATSIWTALSPAPVAGSR